MGALSPLVRDHLAGDCTLGRQAFLRSESHLLWLPGLARRLLTRPSTVNSWQAVPLIAATLGATISLSCAAIAGDDGWSTKSIDSADRTISMPVPGLGSWTPGASFAENYRSGRGTAEHVRWNGFDDRKPNAGLVLNKSEGGFSPAQMQGVKSHVATFIKPLLNGQSFRTDDTVTIVSSKLGDFEALRFRVGHGNKEKNCVFFEKEFSRRKLLNGYYCAFQRRPLYDDIIGRVIGGIDINWNASKGD